MQVGNIPSTKLLPGGALARSGLGDIWSNLFDFGTAVSANQTQASIAQSAAQQSAAQAAAAQAAAAAQIAAANKTVFTTPVLLGIAGAGAALLWFMRRRRK